MRFNSIKDVISEAHNIFDGIDKADRALMMLHHDMTTADHDGTVPFDELKDFAGKLSAEIDKSISSLQSIQSLLKKDFSSVLEARNDYGMKPGLDPSADKLLEALNAIDAFKPKLERSIINSIRTDSLSQASVKLYLDIVDEIAETFDWLNNQVDAVKSKGHD